jgi:hypothetical protein
MSKTIGFIILRHVNNKETNCYWNRSYDSIRKFYPDNHIIIIDDNSNEEFVTERELYNATIIKSEYPGRGELLPYYYYLQNKLFDVAVIIHDSVFINRYIENFNNVTDFELLWTFEHRWDQTNDEIRIIKTYKNDSILHFYINKPEWNGCFGAMSVITYEYLKSVDEQFPLSILLNTILNRYHRCSFERIIAVLLQYKTNKRAGMFGDIFNYITWGLKFADVNKYDHLPLVKVWTGR